MSILGFPDIPHNENREYYPLSCNQRIYWFLNYHHPTLLPIFFSKRISGVLNIELFKKAVNLAVNNHECLRTSFRILHEKPTQFVYHHFKTDMAFEDLSVLTENDPENDAQQLSVSESQYQFDLNVPPLIRVKLCKLSDFDYIFFCTSTLIIFDEPSKDIFWNDILYWYNNLSIGNKEGKKKNRIEFCDYIFWEKAIISQKEFITIKEFWKSEYLILNSCCGPRYLDKSSERYKYLIQKFSLDCNESETRSIWRVCGENGSNLESFFLTIFFVLIRLLINQNEILVGLSVCGRSLDASFKHLVGPFTNICGIRLSLPSSVSLRELLKTITIKIHKANENRQFPVGLFINSCNPFNWGDKASPERFIFNFICQNSEEVSVDGLAVEGGPDGICRRAYDLRVTIREAGKAVKIVFEYNSDLFDKKVIGSHLKLYEKIVNSMISDLEAKIATFIIEPKVSSTDIEPLSRRSAPNYSLNHNIALYRFENFFQAACLRNILKKIWKNLLNLKNVRPNDNFFDLGGDLSSCIELIEKISRAFTVNLTPRQLFDNPTLKSLGDEILRQLIDTSKDRLQKSKLLQLVLPIKPHGSAIPLFLIPGGGGGDIENYVYSQLTFFLSKERPFYQFIAAGLEGINRPHKNIREMSNDYIKAMKLIQPEGPYIIAGECIGGFLAYEIAQKLKKNGECINRLILLDTVMFTDHKFYRDHHLNKSWYGMLRRKVRFFAKRIVKRNESYRSNRLNAQRNYLDVLIRYRPKNYYGNIDLILSQEGASIDEYLGWQKYVKGRIRSYRIEGDHSDYLRKYISQLGLALNTCIEKDASI